MCHLDKETIRCFNRKFRRANETNLCWWLNICNVKGLKWKPYSCFEKILVLLAKVKHLLAQWNKWRNLQYTIRNFFESRILPKRVTVLRQQDCNYVLYVLSTMGVRKESISKFLIGNRFHEKLRILSPENCKQSLRVKSWKAEVTAEKKTNSRLQSKFRNTSSEIITT